MWLQGQADVEGWRGGDGTVNDTRLKNSVYSEEQDEVVFPDEGSSMCVGHISSPAVLGSCQCKPGLGRFVGSSKVEGWVCRRHERTWNTQAEGINQGGMISLGFQWEENGLEGCRTVSDLQLQRTRSRMAGTAVQRKSCKCFANCNTYINHPGTFLNCKF